ncbi:MAG: hypothetical protein QOE86_920 [Solirubrobacteraceae bacterium]|jgi:hypothetical protein|nr:hypothetical protein [Solirubrobacteraceae bacterium]
MAPSGPHTTGSTPRTPAVFSYGFAAYRAWRFTQALGRLS